MRPLGGCTDADPRALLAPNCKSAFVDTVQFLCESVRSIQAATCEQLLNSTSLADLIRPNVPVLETAGIRSHGVLHDPSSFALLLVHLAREQRDRDRPFRFVSTNSNNGWMTVLSAAFLQRTHGGAFSGLAVNDLKAEWAMTGSSRSMLSQVGLSWRSSAFFESAADAALMSFHPHARNSLWPTASALASKLLPMSWVGSPPAFDICWRMAQLSLDGLAKDLAMLDGWCRTFVYHGNSSALQTGTVVRAAATRPGLGGPHHSLRDTVEIGGFTVVRRGAAFAGLRPSGEQQFAFVNKTPPAAPMLFSAACIEDMANCDWHKGA